MDFTGEELLEAVERVVKGLLERAGAEEPPVNALRLAEDHLGIPVEVVEPAEEDEYGRRRPRARPQGMGITLSSDMTPQQVQKVAAEGIARTLFPDILRRLSVVPGSETKPFAAHVRGLIVPRILIPTRLLRLALKDCKYDVPALHQRFSTTTIEAVAMRLLDLEAPCVIAIVDDGVVALRRSNRFPATKRLEDAEQQCHDRIAELELPQRVRVREWATQGWFVPDRPFRRIILRSVRDDDV